MSNSLFIPLQILSQMGITELILGYISFRIAVLVFRMIF